MIGRDKNVRFSYISMILGMLVLINTSPQTRYIHKNARFGEPSPIVHSSHKQPLSAHQAAAWAFKRLTSRGAKQVMICEARWIAAPLTGYLVDAKGNMQMGKDTFRVFRVGIRDGLEEKNGLWKAGDEFVFMACGKMAGGKTVWYPKAEPGVVPNEKSTPEEMKSYLVFQFLSPGEEKDFENLADRYK
jgi:hypothetical protein